MNTTCLLSVLVDNRQLVGSHLCETQELPRARAQHPTGNPPLGGRDDPGTLAATPGSSLARGTAGPPGGGGRARPSAGCVAAAACRATRRRRYPAALGRRPGCCPH